MGLGTKIVAALAALTPAEKIDHVKCWDAIGSVLDQLISPGMIQMCGKSTAPSGYLLCNGVAVSRTTYADLFTAIGTTFGVGDGSTTFNLPDFRGIFPRGAGTNETLGSVGGSVGDYQLDAFQGHKHRQGGWIGNLGVNYVITPWGSYVPSSYPANEPSTNSSEGVEVLPYTSPASYNDGTNGTPRTSTETRPANLSINFIIKT